MGFLGAVFSVVIVAVGSPNEFSLQIIDVALSVKQIFLVVAVELDPAETSASQILRIVNINYVVLLLFHLVRHQLLVVVINVDLGWVFQHVDLLTGLVFIHHEHLLSKVVLIHLIGVFVTHKLVLIIALGLAVN